MASAGPGDPGSWNRYAYTRGDPVNRIDPRGLQDQDPVFSVTGYGYSDPEGGSGGGQIFGEGNLPSTLDPTNQEPGVAQLGGGRPGSSFADAQSAFQRAANALAKKKTFKQPCDDDFAALGTSAAAVRTGAGNAVLQNGVGSDVLESTLYANTPLAAAAAVQFGAITIGQFQAHNPGTVAQAQLNGNTIYLNAALIDPTNYFQNIGVVLHELLHNVTGMTDGAIQSALGLATNQPSNNITQKLIKDCF